MKFRHKRARLFAGALICLSAWSCQGLVIDQMDYLNDSNESRNSPRLTTPTTEEIFNSMSSVCGQCHGPNTPSPIFAHVDTFTQSIAQNPNWIWPHDPSNSPFVKILQGQGRAPIVQMPPGNSSYMDLVDDQPDLVDIDSITAWIESLDLDAAQELDCASVQPGSSPMRRLTADEYRYAVHDIFGLDIDPTVNFPAPTMAHGFDNNAQHAQVTPLMAEHYLDAGISVGDAAMNDFITVRNHLGLNCDVRAAECVKSIIKTIAKKAFRRPLTQIEDEGLESYFDSEYAHSLNLNATASTVIAAVLQSPAFLYRLELIDQEDALSVIPVTGFEMASRLSFFIWSSVPDESLFNAAARGELDSAEGVMQWAEIMVNDSKARRIIPRFYGQWLGIAHLQEQNKSVEIYPNWNAELAGSAVDESYRLAEYLTFESDGSIGSLFHTTKAFIDNQLASVYGLRVPDDGRVYQRDLNQRTRRGIFTRSAFLARHAKHNQSSPILRGVFVREKVLCQPLAPPPENVDDEPPSLDPSATTQERFFAHTQNPSCAGCHTLIDPIGFGFENFDAIGGFRARENGLDIDTEVNLIGTHTLDGRYTDSVELSAAMGQSEEVQTCFSTQWLRFAIGRSFESTDGCGTQSMMTQLAAEDFSLKRLIIAVTQTDSFLYRQIPE